MTGRPAAPAPPQSTESWLAAERSRIDRILDEIADSPVARATAALAEPIAYSLSTRGKRLRPILTAAAFRAVTREAAPEPVYRLACALEIVHTYSLVHDDLPCMDDDALRRGRATVHRVHGAPAAVVAGAALLPLAVRVLIAAAADLGLAVDEAGRLVSELCTAAGATGMVGGQLRDLEAEGREIAGAELEAIHRAKTGALLTASLRIGALAARADSALLRAVTSYGEALGLAFQIVDDVLDVAGDTGALGKSAGRDEALNKASYPALYGLDGARALARERAEEARAALEGIDAPELVALAEYVVRRER